MEDNKKRVYCFGGKTAEGDGSMRELLGGKGANLAEMCKLNIPVPAGFTITTECCTEYYELGGGSEKDRGNHGNEVRRQGESSPGELPFRSKKLNAWHDGYHPQHRSLL